MQFHQRWGHRTLRILRKLIPCIGTVRGGTQRMYDGRRPVRSKHRRGTVSLVRCHRQQQRARRFRNRANLGAERNAGFREQNRRHRSKPDQHRLRHGVPVLASEPRLPSRQDCTRDGQARHICDIRTALCRAHLGPAGPSMAEIHRGGESVAENRERRPVRRPHGNRSPCVQTERG